MLSRFSILKNYGTLPGPDDCFSHIQQDARPLFEKLLGLELEYPGASGPLTPYSSMNYYRSHIEEVFHHTTRQGRPFPPIEGRCVMYFAATDVLRVSYELTNKSAAEVKLRLRWFSKPAPGLSCRQRWLPDGFRYECVQQVHSKYRASATVTGVRFRRGFVSDWQPATLAARETRTWNFEVRFNNATARPVKLRQAIAAVETRYAALPELPREWRRFEPVVLRAAGIILSTRYTERNGTPTIHGGKTGVEAVWFWDTATTLLGTGLLRDATTGWGTIRLMADGIKPNGEPFVRYCDGQYIRGAQNPVLAWGVWNFHCLCPNRAELRYAYPALGRYVNWWLDNHEANGIGLYRFPPTNCTGLDDALQWQDKFPIALRPGERWHAKDWGHSRPNQFVSPDVNSQLYLELRALAQMARELGRNREATAWDERATALAGRIHAHLFNPVAGIYQARSIVDGRFNEIVSLESFLPIYAGITPRPLARQLCRQYLLNPDRFYTTLPFPTLDRRHEAFRSSGNLYQPPAHPEALVQQAYWIGRTWLNYSYWMVGALHQAGLVKEADAAAEKILDAVSRNETIYECYDPLTGTGTGHAEFPWGAASVLALAYRCYQRALRAHRAPSTIQ